LNGQEFHFCWSIDCESTRREIGDPHLGRDAIQGFASLLDGEGWTGTFFLTPEEIRAMPDTVRALSRSGHEIGLHPHPDEGGWRSPYLGTYSEDDQSRIIQQALTAFVEVTGKKPVTCRPGYASANDGTFGVLASNGFLQTSASMPGRCMSSLASNWAGAPLFAHYTHPYNRLLAGSLNLVEFPISVDWETMIWGGRHPQDLRVEFTDAKNHSFVIEKVMRRQVSENVPVKALLPFTHNIFRYGDANDFRRETMLGMIDTMKRCAGQLGFSYRGTTIADAAGEFRSSVPAPATD
jgi:peptidoglycan/xylan/chitin deacetylase (PgdA/CDA1 family)